MEEVGEQAEMILSMWTLSLGSDRLLQFATGKQRSNKSCWWVVLSGGAVQYYAVQSRSYTLETVNEILHVTIQMKVV